MASLVIRSFVHCRIWIFCSLLISHSVFSRRNFSWLYLPFLFFRRWHSFFLFLHLLVSDHYLFCRLHLLVNLWGHFLVNFGSLHVLLCLLIFLLILLLDHLVVLLMVLLIHLLPRLIVLYLMLQGWQFHSWVRNSALLQHIVFLHQLVSLCHELFNRQVLHF